MKAKLNNSKISQLGSDAVRKGKSAEGHDTQIDGLGIVMHPSGKGVWRINYRDPKTGERRRKKFGKFPALSIAQARLIASDKFQQIALGIYPFAAPENEVLTVEKAWNRYLAEYMSNRSEKYQLEARGYGRRDIIPKFGDVVMTDLSRGDLLAYIDTRRSEKKAAGDTLYRYSHAFFEWCLDFDLIEVNPIAKKRAGGRGRDRGADRGRTNRRDRVLSDEELGRWLAAATLARDIGEFLPTSIRPSPIYCDATLMLFATGKRLMEVIEAPMREFEIGEHIWIIPPERRKGIRCDTPPEKRKPEVVPLFDLASEVLNRRKRSVPHEFVFSLDGKRPYKTLSRNTERLLALARVKDATHHDFRRTITTKLASWKLGAEVRHAVLGHVGALDGDELDGVYNRYSYADEKADALESWDEFLKKLREEWVPVLISELTGKGVEIPEQVESGIERLPLH
jgi:hypothetical protein